MGQLHNQTLVKQLKAFCVQERTRIENRHRFGIRGTEIVEEYSRLADNVIQRIYQASIQGGILSKEMPLAILAVGGYGRVALNPHSDIDVMLVYDNSKLSTSQIEPFANQLIAMLWDVGFDVGHSCRSIKECIKATYQDLFSKTSMIEARYITGAKTVHQQFQNQTSKHFYKRQINKFIAQTIREWNERHQSYGSTIYLQEPNIKESVGGLRDFHTAIWVAAVRYGIKELADLAKRKIVPSQVAEACEASLDFLWRLRNELHYVTKRRSDQLAFEVQHTMAKNLGYTDEGNVLAEEAMMRDYYLHAEHLFEFAKLIIDLVKYKARPGSRTLNRLRSVRLSDGFLVSRKEICFQPGYSGFSTDPTRIMKLFVHRQRLGYRVGADVRYEIAANLALIDEDFRRTRENARIFLSILGNPTRVAETLRRMHRWQVLDRYLPEFGKIRSLVRYDRPHQYTVDEHTMYAIENLEEKTLAGMKDGKYFIEMLNSLEKPELLRLAVLFHDVGKGIEGPGDHDDRSLEAAKAMLDRLGLPEPDRKTVLFLIARHLDMHYTSRQRDLDDPTTIEQFAKLVGNEQNAMMLYLLTFADIRAVSAGIWTEWSAVLLRELYQRTVKFLRGESYRLKLDELQKEVTALIGESVGKDLIQRHFEMMPDQELAGNSPGFISKQIQLVHQLGDKPIAVSCFKEIETHTQIGICTRDERGTFRQITGVLASENANIMSAEIETRYDGLVIDAVNLTDESSRKSLSPEQRERITQALEGVWGGKVHFEAAIQKQEDENPQSRGRRNLSPRITIDNSGSSLATIIDIRAQDQVGLLYAISDTFYNLNLDIRIAKITTEGFTAMDSFYVTEQDGYKITNLQRLDEIKKSLIDRLSSAR